MAQRTITRFRAGEPLLGQLTAERLNDLLDLVESKGVEFGDNITGTRTSSGTIVRAKFSGGGGSTITPFKLTIVDRTPPEAGQYAVNIIDGKVNNEWPDVGADAMGVTGSRTLNVATIGDSNVFLRVMFNAKTNKNVRLDIYERPNATFPTNKITFLAPDAEPIEGACDAVDNPNDPPPAGFGAIHILLGFTYLKPPPEGSPPGTESTPTAFNLVRDHINFQFVWGSKNGLPALLPVAVYCDWTKIPLSAP